MSVKRILIGCSGTYIHNLHSGTKRVVRNIVERKDLIEDKLGVSVIPVMLTKFGYISLDDFLQSQSTANKQSLKEKVQYFLAAKLRNDYLYKVVKLLWDMYRRISYTIFDFIEIFAKKPTKLISLNENDMLLFIQPFKSFIEIIKNINKSNAVFVLLIHDILPVTNPELCPDSSCANKFFKVFFEKIVPYVNFLLTISQSEKKIIENYISSIGVNKPIDYFYLGSDLPTNNNKDQLLRQEILSFKEKSYFLMVGSIAPRKGYGIAIEAFEYLWKNGFNKTLVIVGGIAWSYSKVLNPILKSPHYNKKLFMFNEANDSELDYLYNNAQALIFAAEREGFGIPLVEAMQKQIPVLASDIDVFREIGNDYPVYFNPKKKDDLIQAIKSFERRMQTKNPNGHFLNWDESVEMLCEKIKKYID